MALKPASVHDDTGQRYLVFEADPGWDAVRKLHNVGVKEVVLPRTTLLTGEVTMPSVPHNMGEWDVSIEAVATLLRRYTRLLDCVGYLDGTYRIQPVDDREDADVTVAAG